MLKHNNNTKPKIHQNNSMITFGAESDFTVYFALSWIVFLCLFVFQLLLFCKRILATFNLNEKKGTRHIAKALRNWEKCM